MIYIGNGFSVAMLREDATIRIQTITKQEFLDAGKTAYSIIGHPEIANHFGLRLNRETVTLTEGDVLYVVTPSKRPKAGELVENGAKYQFIPESEGYAYKKIRVCSASGGTTYSTDIMPGMDLLKSPIRVDTLNSIYKENGFMGVREYVLGSLLYGDFVKMDDGLYMAFTGGWSEDEDVINDLISLPSMFRRHYVGYVCGGAYYFVEDPEEEVIVVKKF